MTISLAFLAPSLVKAAVEGRLPHGIGVARLSAPSRLTSFEVATIVGRGLPGDPMKGSAERARAVETHIARNLGDRCAGGCQQGLGALNPRPVQ